MSLDRSATPTVEGALHSRRSIRAFRPDPVPSATITAILDAARHAPSGTNMQPWKVIVLTGAAKDMACARMHQEYLAGGPPAYDQEYYLTEWREPYKSRRKATGIGLYGLLGIGKEDKDKALAQGARNALFFDAPVGLIFTIDKDLRKGSWLDYGMFLQSVMLMARVHGLDTCPQASIAQFHATLSDLFDIPETETVVCGIALGYADETALVNTFQPDRLPVDQFTRFVDGAE